MMHPPRWWRRAVPLLTACGVAVACAALPQPRIFGAVDAVRESAAATTARELAPQAFLAAEDLRRRAHAAYDAKDLPAAQVLGEHAIAAYEHAFVLARLARAERLRTRAQLEVEQAARTLAALDEQQRRVAAEADALELRVQVATELEPLPSSGPAGPDREQARRDAARALLLQARLTCMATRLLNPDADGLAALLTELTALDQRLSGARTPAPIDEALRARSGCLATLTKARRSDPARTADVGAPDRLLVELGDLGTQLVFRDDRGVVVLLRGLFSGANELTPGAAATVARIARVAQAHADFPLLVVLHGPGLTTKQATQRAERLTNALRLGGAPRVESALAGDALPLVDPSRAGAADQNQRVEVVFVAPSP